MAESLSPVSLNRCYRICRNQPAEKPAAPVKSPAPDNDPEVTGALDSILLIGYLTICTFIAKSAPACSMPQLALPGRNDVI